jgi:hypothetical protein
MGNDVQQWRSSIGGFVGGRIQQIVKKESYNYKGDARVALLIFTLLVAAGSVHPNPGPPFKPFKPFQSHEENMLFNQIRSLEGKLIRMESHFEFVTVCTQRGYIPPGIDFKMHLSTAFNKRQLNMENLMKQSKLSLLKSISQHYENQIPLLRNEINNLYSRLSNITANARFNELKQDLAYFLRRVRNNCKKTKTIKMRKMERKTRNIEPATWLPNLNLNYKERNIILGGDWLNDEIIDAAAAILKKKHPYVTGLVNASFSLHGFDYNPCEGIQFHNINRCHWVLSSSVGGRVKVYDSLITTVSHDLTNQINQLYAPANSGGISFQRMRCQQQVGSSECGLFSIAFAVDLLEGNDISEIVYDQSQMRNHLLKCLETNQLSPFPRKRVNLESRKKFDKICGEWEEPKTS